MNETETSTFTQTIQLPHEELEQIVIDHLMMVHGAPEHFLPTIVDFGLPVTDNGYVLLDVTFAEQENDLPPAEVINMTKDTEGLLRTLRVVK